MVEPLNHIHQDTKSTRLIALRKRTFRHICTIPYTLINQLGYCNSNMVARGSEVLSEVLSEILRSIAGDWYQWLVPKRNSLKLLKV